VFFRTQPINFDCVFSSTSEQHGFSFGYPPLAICVHPFLNVFAHFAMKTAESVLSNVLPLGVYINTCSGISIVTVANSNISIYDSTVNLSTNAVHAVLVVFNSSLYEKCRIGRPSVVEYGSAEEGHKKTQRAQFVSPKCCSLCRYQSCCCWVVLLA
jgi:hypothetical protein